MKNGNKVRRTDGGLRAEVVKSIDFPKLLVAALRRGVPWRDMAAATP